MILYQLTCAEGHGFDGWFRSSGDFDAQSARALLECPVCGSQKVEKALMAPTIAKGTPSPAVETTSGQESEPPAPVALLTEKEARLRAMLRDVRRQVVARSEDVGDRFPEIARQMHAEEAEPRSIRGRATAEEVKELIEEGIDILPLPPSPDDGN
ncbi:DUF1178 family protein [Hansschlegelia sp. KR7-227]|uniref:DUF1178 family protein n=1 Tax=Hansschlegelia sp. KR7-227 TaxID=3400914 RepID=UPI003C02D5A9